MENKFDRKDESSMERFMAGLGVRLDSRPTLSRGLALRGNDDDGRGNDEREGFWRVEKMKVPKTDGKKDLTRLIYNAHITVSGIPP